MALDDKMMIMIAQTTSTIKLNKCFIIYASKYTFEISNLFGFIRRFLYCFRL
jgi:hypothetical protein